jgi:hypothetical protein
MQWTKEQTTWLGTYREKRGRWHGIPYVLRTNSPKGMNGAGWAVVIAAALILLTVILVEQLLI